VTKQCVPLTLDDTSLSDVRKTCSCGDPHIANIVVPAIDHNQTLIIVVAEAGYGWGGAQNFV
jgi:hypothetical protein